MTGTLGSLCAEENEQRNIITREKLWMVAKKCCQGARRMMLLAGPAWMSQLLLTRELRKLHEVCVWVLFILCLPTPMSSQISPNFSDLLLFIFFFSTPNFCIKITRRDTRIQRETKWKRRGPHHQGVECVNYGNKLNQDDDKREWIYDPGRKKWRLKLA